MRCNRLASKGNFFVIATILLVLFLMPTKVDAGICYNSSNPKGAGNCIDGVGTGICMSPQVYSADATCAEVQNAADLIEDAKKIPAAGDSKKQGLGALKASVDTLTAGKVNKSLEEVIGGYIKTALILVGTLFMALTFYGGYIWFIAREDEEEAKRARSIISMALIGLIIVLAAYFVTYFIIYRLTAAIGVGL